MCTSLSSSTITVADPIQGTGSAGSAVTLKEGAGITNNGAGSASVDTSVIQARVSGTCTSPNAIAVVSSSGTVTCTTGVLNTTNVSGTTNDLAVFTGTNVVGNANETDNGTTFAVGASKLATTIASGNTTIAGTLTADATHRVFDVAGTGLTSSTNTISLNMAGASCSAGNVVTALSATGTGTCTAIGTAGGTTGSGTANDITKWSGSTALANSSLQDDGTTFTWGTNTTTEASGNTTIHGTLTADATHRVIDTVGTGLAQTANSVALNINSGSTQTCSAGMALTSLTSAAIGTCTAFSSSTVASTANVLKGDSGGNAIASGITDDGATVATAEAVSLTGGATVTGGTTTDTRGEAGAPHGRRDIAPDRDLGHGQRLRLRRWNGGALLCGGHHPGQYVGFHDAQRDRGTTDRWRGSTALRPELRHWTAHDSEPGSCLNPSKPVLDGQRLELVTAGGADETTCFFYDATAARWTQNGSYHFAQLGVGGSTGAAFTVTNSGVATAIELARKRRLGDQLNQGVPDEHRDDDGHRGLLRDTDGTRTTARQPVTPPMASTSP